VFYSLLKQLVALALKMYFRKIYLVGHNKVPGDQPIIIAANHPMAFCDACLLACFLERPLHFLVRGDVFQPAWLWFFEWTNQIPIYRFRDGFGNMRKNAESFVKVNDKLKDGAAVLIFAEGNTKLQKRLDPLQKGPARIAFGAMEQHGLPDLAMVPIGINYSDGSQFRSDVYLSVGDPIALADFDISSKEKKNASVRELTAQLYDALLPHVIHLDTVEREDLHGPLDRCEYPFLRDRIWPILDERPDRFRAQKNLAQHLNQMADLQVQRLKERVQTENMRSTTHPFRILLLALTMPFLVLGFLLNALPFYAAKLIAKKRVKLIEFYTPVRIGLTIVFMILYLAVFSIVGALSWGWPGFLFVLLTPILGYLAIIIREEIFFVEQPGKSILKTSEA